MSSGVRNFAPFGVSRGKNNRSSNNNSGKETTKTAKASSNQPTSIQQTFNTRLPIVNINQVKGNAGDMVLNTEDNCVYFFNGRKWNLLAINNNKELFVENGQVNLFAHTFPGGKGANVVISSGMGGLADGEIQLNIGNEAAIVIGEEQIVLHKDLVLRKGDPLLEKISGKESLERQAEPVEEKVEMYSLNMDSDERKVKIASKKGSITLNGTIIGETNIELESDFISSWVQLTAQCAEGVPYVFVVVREDGVMKLCVKSLSGELTNVTIHYHIV